ncbi:MAG: succinate dehydrogenase cytochrome b subunit [Bacteroidota bacterium]
MSWLSSTFSSSIGQKVIMSLTGLFLCSFLLVHLSGNFQLLAGDNGLAFNAYAKFMTTFPLIKVLSYGLYAGILLHAIKGLALAYQNYKARPVKYGYTKPGTSSSWASRNMAILGTIVLLFIIIHMKNFWYEMHFGEVPMDANGNKNLYAVVSEVFSLWWYVALYVIAMASVAFHLLHGFQSAFQTLGLNHKKYSPTIKIIGVIFSIGVPLGFASIPIYMFIQSMG